jgi:hypothetical protein
MDNPFVILFERVDEQFDEQALQELCSRIAVDYDGLRVDGKRNKARELVRYCKRCDRIGVRLSWQRVDLSEAIR